MENIILKPCPNADHYWKAYNRTGRRDFDFLGIVRLHPSMAGFQSIDPKGHTYFVSTDDPYLAAYDLLINQMNEV